MQAKLQICPKDFLRFQFVSIKNMQIKKTSDVQNVDHGLSRGSRTVFQKLEWRTGTVGDMTFQVQKTQRATEICRTIVTIDGKVSAEGENFSI